MDVLGEVERDGAECPEGPGAQRAEAHSERLGSILDQPHTTIVCPGSDAIDLTGVAGVVDRHQHGVRRCVGGHDTIEADVHRFAGQRR